MMVETTRYEVRNIVYVPPGRARQLRATFDLHVSGLGVIRACRMLAQGSHRWVVGPSMKDEYRGWFMVVRLEKEASGEILEAFDREAADADKRERETSAIEADREVAF